MGLFYTKWKLYKENYRAIEEETWPFFGITNKRDWYGDIYIRYNRLNGLPKYKYVEKIT